MKFFISMIIIALLLSCNEEKKYSQGSQEYYADLLKKKLSKNGIRNTTYFSVDTGNMDIENLSHDEIISNINKAVPVLKERYEAAKIAMQNTQKANASKKMFGDELAQRNLNLLIRIVNEQRLESKEPFYEKLLALKSKSDQIALYNSQCDEYKEKMAMAADYGDLRMAFKIQEKYAYLEVIARDQNGANVPLDLLNNKKRGSISFSIKKYDSLHIQMLKNIKWPKEK